MKKFLKIQFSGFYPGFQLENNLFYRLLSRHYDVELVSRRPDILLYSGYGYAHHRNIRARKIWWTAENTRPDYNECLASLCFDPNSERNVYFPSWLNDYDFDRLTIPELTDPVSEAANKEAFCLFLVSNPDCEYRNALFHAISSYKRVDSPGKVFNNMPRLPGNASEAGDPRTSERWFHHKRRAIRRYKFNIACENSAFPGYTTEKIFDSLMARVVPIYWGDPDVDRVVNPAAFIDCRSFPDQRAVARHVAELDHDDGAYQKLLSQPIFLNNRLPEFLTPDFIAGRMAEMVELALHGQVQGRTYFQRVSHQALRIKLGLQTRIQRLSTKLTGPAGKHS